MKFYDNLFKPRQLPGWWTRFTAKHPFLPNFIAIAGLALLVAACGVWMIVANRHGITADGYEKIQNGMTQQQVEAILGGPPGDYGPESVANETRRE